MNVRVRIENVYTDGHQSDREVELEGPCGDIEDWWQRVVFPETGDGHGGEALYGATIIRADDASLLGLNYEWQG